MLNSDEKLREYFENQTPVVNGRHIGKTAEQMDIDVNVTTVIMVGNANSGSFSNTVDSYHKLEQFENIY